jgi:DNA-binding NarL/FixJ family response regulator
MGNPALIWRQTMPTFNMTLAHTITCFGSVTVEADSFADAVEQVREAAETAPAEGIWDIYDVDYQHPCEQRIVSIEDEDGGTTVSDIDLTHHDAPWVILSAEDVAAILSEELAA